MGYTLWESGSINGSIDTGFTGSLIYWTVQSNGQWITQVSSSESRQMDSDSLPILRFQMQFCEVTFILGFLEFLKWIHCPFFVAWLEVALLACFICSFFCNKQLRKKRMLWKLDGFHTVSCVVFGTQHGPYPCGCTTVVRPGARYLPTLPKERLARRGWRGYSGGDHCEQHQFLNDDANSFAGFSWNREWFQVWNRYFGDLPGDFP